MNNIFIVLILAVALLEIGGDILFKEWVIRNDALFIILGVILYMLATIVWAFSLKFQNLSRAVVIFAVLTLIVGVLVGVFIYKEDMTVLQIVGVICGLASIVLLEL